MAFSEVGFAAVRVKNGLPETLDFPVLALQASTIEHPSQDGAEHSPLVRFPGGLFLLSSLEGKRN